MTPLLNPDDAIQQILAQIHDPTPTETPIADADNRVLAADIIAEIDLPPFANSSVDGYAVLSADAQTVPTTLAVVMDIPAGVAPPHALQPRQAARIMTGAPLPEGADAVIPVEQTNHDWRSDATEPLAETVTIQQSADPGDNVRPVGENIQRGETVLRAGTRLRPQDIGMIASLGMATAPTYRPPIVAILGSGDELAAVGDTLQPGQIYDSNSYTVAALVRSHGGRAIRYDPAADTMEAVRSLFRSALKDEPDLIISTAGVSVGAFDVVRTVLEELGEVGFWRVNVRPGKPLAFGQLQGVPFFGLPGNPVSAMVTFDLFVRPALLKLGGRPDETPIRTAQTDEDIESDGRQTYVRVQLRKNNDQLIATTTGTQSSGALMSMVLADGLLVIPEGETHVPAGTSLPVRLLR